MERGIPQSVGIRRESEEAMSDERDKLVKALEEADRKRDEAVHERDEADRKWYEADRKWNDAYRNLREYDEKARTE